MKKHKCTSCGYEYEVNDGNEDWVQCPDCDLHYKHRRFDKAEYIGKHIKIYEFGYNIIMIECGHGRAGDHVIRIRQDDPEVIYSCCVGCYHMISGDMIRRAFTVRMK